MGLVLIALVGCAASSPIRLRSTVSTGGQTLTLLAASGYKINARLTPALELPDGRVIRFASTELTPDSNYFTAPPTARLAGNRPVRGRLRAGVCRTGGTVCNVVTIDVALSLEP